MAASLGSVPWSRLRGTFPFFCFTIQQLSRLGQDIDCLSYISHLELNFATLLLSLLPAPIKPPLAPYLIGCLSLARYPCGMIPGALCITSLLVALDHVRSVFMFLGSPTDLLVDFCIYIQIFTFPHSDVEHLYFPFSEIQHNIAS